MRRAMWVILLAGFFAVASIASYAAINPFGPSGMPLTKGDYQAMALAADPLLNDDTLPIGSARDWSNEKSGNHGSIKLLGRFQYKFEGNELPCRKLEYNVEIKNMADPYKIALNRCKVADGSWKIL